MVVVARGGAVVDVVVAAGGDVVAGAGGATVVVVVWRAGTVVVEEVGVVVVVPRPRGNCNEEGDGGVKVAPDNEYTCGKVPAHCGSAEMAAAMKACQSSAGTVPPCTLPIGR